MSKKAVSVTLHPDNLLWLRARVKAKGGRSLSEALDGIITDARAGIGASAAEVRSVVGNARIPRSEEALSEAGAQVAALFRRSVRRKEKVSPGGSRNHVRPAAPRRKRA
jgi:hypothetical protein